MSVLSAFDVSEKVVVVTGAGRGIGRELALELAASAATVVACSRTAADLQSLENEAEPSPGAVLPVCADVSSLAGIEKVIGETIQMCGRIDGLVNNAGADKRRAALDYSEEEFDDLIGLNLKAAYWMSVFAARQMIPTGQGGSIVNIASQAAILGSPGRAPYSAAKAGLVNLSRCLAVEWGRHGVRVNAVAPGVTLTAPVEKALKERPAFAAEVRERVLLGRPAAPAEIAAPIIFLLSSAANMVTGHTLVVDGGWTAAWTATMDVSEPSI